MTAINEDMLLTRKRAAEFLGEHGFPISVETLASKAVRGGGPVFHKFGRVPLYRAADLLAWAEGRLTGARATTAEHAHDRSVHRR
jgi:hypothetical protein